MDVNHKGHVRKRTLEQGEDSLISGFGKFKVLSKNERRGRNVVATQTCSHV